MITINAFTCADSILIPVQAAYLLVKGHEGREKIKAIIEDAWERLASGEATLRWRHVKSPESLLLEIVDLDRENWSYLYRIC